MIWSQKQLLNLICVNLNQNKKTQKNETFDLVQKSYLFIIIIIFGYEIEKTKTKVFKFRVLELLETKIFISSLYKVEDSIYMEQGFISASSVQAFIYFVYLLRNRITHEMKSFKNKKAAQE